MVDTFFQVGDFSVEIDAHAKDASGVGQGLCDIPQYALRDVAAVVEKRQEGQHNAREDHGDGRAILNPVFA